ncbi:MAG: hypothetical protein HC800_07155 [Phormidesmis sp. RL_2_1]|nr:hypothetical protein [Phormidesmis sp. RL_2_1]
MSYPICSESATYSPALLALKRLIRGTLKQVGIAIAALLVVLSVSSLSVGSLSVGSLSISHYGVVEAAPQSGAVAVQLTKPFHGLNARMTAHHITNARLAIPPMAFLTWLEYRYFGETFAGQQAK